MNKRKLPKINKKNEVANVSNETTLIPKSKSPLVQVAHKGKEICIKATKGLVKVTNKALSVIGNKLANVDWGKLILTLLKELLGVKEEVKVTRVYYTKETTKPKTQKVDNLEQIQSTKTKGIETVKQKQVEAKKKPSIETKKKSTQLQQQKDRGSIKAQNKPFLIEKKQDK